MVDIQKDVENQLEKLLEELKSPEIQLTTTIKTALEMDLQEPFRQKLEKYTQECDERIESMCSTNYTALVEYVNELALLKNDFGTFNINLKNITDDVKEMNSELEKCLTEAANLNLAKENIEKTIEMLTKCLPAYEVYIKMNTEIDNDIRKSLEYCKLLESKLLPPIKHFRFINSIITYLPEIKNTMKVKSKNSLLEFLEKAKIHGTNIGLSAYNYASYIFGAENTSSASINIRSFEGLMDILDFTILHRYMLIVEEIGNKGKEDQFYRTERSLQFNTLSDWTIPLGTDVYKGFYGFILRVIGFFVIEAFVSSTVPNTFSRGEVNEMLDRCVRRLAYQMETQCNIENAKDLSTLKDLVTTFHHISSVCGLYSTMLLECDRVLSNKFNNALSKISEEKMIQFSNDIVLKPMVLNSKDEESDMFQLFPLPSFSRQNKYPKTLPFSLFVPTACQETLKYVKMCSNINDKKLCRTVDVETELKVAGKYFLKTVIYKNLVTIIDNCKNLQHFVQVYFDIFFLDSYLVVLDTRISEIAESKTNKKEDVTNNMIKNMDIFKSLLLDVEDVISDFIGSKTKDMTLAVLKTCNKKKDRIEACETVMNFLKAVVKIISNLPNRAYTSLFIRTMKDIGDTVMEFLVDEKTHISKSFLNNVQDFINELSKFVMETEVDGLNNESKKSVLSETEQTVSLILTDDWNSFFNTYSSPKSSYSNVKIESIISIYSKVANAFHKGDIKGTFQNLFKPSHKHSDDSNDIISKLKSLKS